MDVPKGGGPVESGCCRRQGKYAPLVQNKLAHSRYHLVACGELRPDMLVQKLDHMAPVIHGNRSLDMARVGEEACCRKDGHARQQLRVNTEGDVVFDVGVRGVGLPVQRGRELGYELDDCMHGLHSVNVLDTSL